MTIVLNLGTRVVIIIDNKRVGVKRFVVFGFSCFDVYGRLVFASSTLERFIPRLWPAFALVRPLMLVSARLYFEHFDEPIEAMRGAHEQLRNRGKFGLQERYFVKLGQLLVKKNLRIDLNDILQVFLIFQNHLTSINDARLIIVGKCSILIQKKIQIRDIIDGLDF